MFTNKIKTVLGTGTVCVLAATALSGCVVSDDPAINTLATVATVGVVSSLFYSNNDGYYYDESYNRMPRGYRPAYNARIFRVDNMDTYRRRHPLDNRRADIRFQQERMERERLISNRMREDSQRRQAMQTRERFEQQRRYESNERFQYEQRDRRQPAMFQNRNMQRPNPNQANNVMHPIEQQRQEILRHQDSQVRSIFQRNREMNQMPSNNQPRGNNNNNRFRPGFGW